MPGIVLTAATADKHVLYENAVQGVEASLDFMARIFRRQRKRRLRTLREDFCGTAQLCCAWARRSRLHAAWGVDVDAATLEWGRRNHLSRLGPAAERVSLICADVREASAPPVDAIAAFNFSFNALADRAALRRYFQAAYAGLGEDGIFFLDEFGGPESHKNVYESREVVEGRTPDGRRLATYTYEWEQREYNPLTHHLICHIHFAFSDGTRLDRAFSYRWRLWTVPELVDLLREVGFAHAEIYLQGWDEARNEADGVFRRRTSYDDWDSWFGYLVALK